MIHHKPDGTPFARPYLGRYANGKPIRPYKEFPNMTDDEAERAAKRWVQEWATAHDLDGTLTTNQALNNYIDQLEAMGNSKNTIRMYRHYADAYLLDLASKRITEVTTSDLDENIQALLTEGAGVGGPLSASTVQTYRAFLQGAWRVLVRYGIVGANVVRDTMRPQANPHEARALDETDTRELIKAVRRDLREFPTQDDAKAILARIRALAVYVALFTGARVGEVAALRVRDVSFTLNRITICGNVVMSNGQPIRQSKTKGKRTRSLFIDQDVSAQLKKHAQWLGDIIRPFGKDTPICTVDGTYVNPNTLSHGFTIYRKRLGLDVGLTFHALRHTHATTLLQRGVNPRVIQERLGHADVRTTLAIYGHVMPTNDREAANIFTESINY